ncbi:MAG: hypothetical protein FJ149_11920 [Euryarchaeota archaeon]|nr:hypothetical protein [Euryarchaeota archaeon]
MNLSRIAWIGAGATTIFALAVLCLALPAAATNDPAPGGGTVYGDWTVTDTRSYDSVTITIDNGNLVVQNGASLTLTNVVLRMTGATDGAYSITVAKGGTLTVDPGTDISSSDGAVHYKFVVRGSMDMDGARVSQVWGDNASWAGGIQIHSDGVSINNTTIFNGRTGGVSIFDCSPSITNCTIIDNGQDGGSPVYCFGLYATNSKATISRNDISRNGFKVVKSERTTYQASKSPPQGFSGYPEYEGETYYGMYYRGVIGGYSTYYGYRYEYNYTYKYGDYDYYGVGVRMDDSNLTLESNKITFNGWGRADGSYSYSYNSYQPWKYYYSGSIKYEYWLYLYKYNYNYIKVRCFGEGLHVEDSTLTLESNTFDHNGFQSRHDYWPNADSIGWYSGVDVNLYGCDARIFNNTINNAAILVNLTRCSVTISGNKLLGDFIGQGATYYSTNFIPWRVGYGIRYYQSRGDILNNTIDMKFKDYPIYIGGSSTYFADLVTAVDFPGAKDTTFRGNKVTVDSQYYGVVRGLLFNTSLKATNLKVLDCQFEFKYSGSVSTGKPDMPEFIISLKSEAYIQGCTFKGPAGGTGAPRVFGIEANFGTTLKVEDTSFAGHHMAIRVTDFSRLTATNITVTGVQEAGIYADALSKVTLIRSKISGNARGLMSIKSVVDIYDCQLSNPTEFYIDRAASINVYNTPHVRQSVLAVDEASYLNVSWPVTLSVRWQNGVPVADAKVDISTLAGLEVFAGTTNDTGYPADLLWIKEYVVYRQTLSNYNPHRIEVSKGRATSMDLFVIDKALSIDFLLVDNVPPELLVSYPFDLQRLNTAVVEFTGSASDPEAGLAGSVVEINIDNSGWIPVEVSGAYNGWSYSRPLGDGLHVVRLKATDNAGNVARQSLSITVDTTGPPLYVFSPADGSSTNLRTVTVSGITEEGVFVTVNGISVQVQKRYFSLPVSLEDGPNLVTVVASDAAGNSRQVQVQVTLDNQPPLMVITSPADGTYTGQNPVSVLGSTEPTAIITVNGVRAQLVESSFEALVGLSEGANTMTVTARDPAGNSASRTLTVYLDTVPPDVTLFSPRDGLWTNQSKVLVNGATEQGAVVTINGQHVNVISTIFSGYVSLLEGPNRIEVQARDGAGNRFSSERTVFLDTRRPDLVVGSPADGSVLASRIVTVVGSVDYGAEVRVNGEPVRVTDFVFTTTVQFPEDGTQVLEVQARDLAGNQALVTRTVTVDTTVPTVLLSYPPDGLRTRQRMITVSGQTEPYATVIVNTETLLAVGRDGLFQVPVVLEDGENRLTVQTTDAAGNMHTESIVVTKPVAAEAVKEDLSWVLNLTGLLLGVGVALPIMTHVLTGSWRRRRAGVLAELEAAEQARREREAEAARLAALPKVEKMGKRRARAAVAVKEEKAPEALPEAPKAEAAAPEAAKTGLKDKSGATEVSPDEIDQETKMRAKSEPESEEPPGGKAETTEAGLKDKGGEAEGEAGETEMPDRKK